MNTWNDFFWPLIYLNDPSKQTLALGLLQLKGAIFFSMEYHDGGFYINDNSCVSLVFRSKSISFKESVLLLEAKASLPRNKKKI